MDKKNNKSLNETTEELEENFEGPTSKESAERVRQKVEALLNKKEAADKVLSRFNDRSDPKSSLKNILERKKKNKESLALKAFEKAVQKEVFDLQGDNELPLTYIKEKYKEASEIKLESTGFVHVSCRKQNNIVTITDKDGNAITQATSGGLGFRGHSARTPLAVSVTTRKAAVAAARKGMKQVAVRFKGSRIGRLRTAVKALQGTGLKVMWVSNATPIPHGGCRLKKQKRK